jgi:hypothetical protein
VTAPRIARNCVGHYLIVGLRLNQVLRRELEAEGWRWARGLRRGGGYFTDDLTLAEQTAVRLGLEIRR